MKIPTLLTLHILLFTFILAPKTLMGAACCGGGSSGLSLITGDVRTQLNLSLVRSKLLGNQLNNIDGPLWKNSEDNKTQKIFLQGSYQFDDYYQIGFGLPYFFKQTKEGSTRKTGQHVGDIEVQVAFEILPEALYSEWQPRIFLFSKLTFPSGLSPYEKQNYTGVEITGRGFNSLSLGTLIFKKKGRSDFQFLVEVHKGFEQRFKSKNLFLEPGFGTSAQLSVGHTPHGGPWRWGLSVAPHFEAQKNLNFSNKNIKTKSELYWDATASGSYTYSRSTSFHFSITDQTIFGLAYNTSLSRTFAFNVQRRWPL